MNPSTTELPKVPASSTDIVGATAHQLFARQLETVSVKNDGGQGLLERIALRTPVLIADLAQQWPAVQNWTPEYLSARYGDQSVRLYDASFGDPGEHYMDSFDTMSFADFLRETLVEGRDLRMFLYNISRQIPELLDDVVFPELGLHFSRRFVYTFFGCQGSTTPLHYDIDMGHVFYTAIQGRRRVRLFAPDQSPALHRHPFTVRSYANLDTPDFAEHPALASAQGFEVVVEPGQTLFLPSGYWHEFHYLDAGFGLSLRAGSRALRDSALGLANLLALSPIDRLANKIASGPWFDWKQRKAHARGCAYMEKDR